MAEEKEKYSFWTKYKKFAGTEIMLYVIMIVGIILGIIIFS
jgi:cell division protein FtsL